MPQRAHFRTGDQALVREINLSLIMQRFLEHTSLSRAALAEVTGLNKSTVSSLVQELIEMQFVHEIGLSSSGVGRPSVMLELNPQAGYFVSCELGVDFVSVICTNFVADVVWRHRETIGHEKGQRAIMDRVLALLHDAVTTGAKLCAGCGGLLGIAVGAPGLIDEETGTLLFAPNLRWENVPLCGILSDAFTGTPIFVDNEANLAALGEYLFGAAKGYREVLFISAGVGLGGAVVQNGQLARGTTGFAGEFGHMTMDPDGEACNCGNRGCWETQVSQLALFRRIRHAIEQGQDSVLCTLADNDLDHLSVPLVVEAARSGDSVALGALEHIGRYLGIGIASLVNALNPDLVVFGGILSLAGDFVLPSALVELRRRALRWNARATQVMLAQHGSDACVMGGVAIIYQAILSQPGKFNSLKRLKS
jgi:glucokinase-like ROK family protein